MHPDEVIASLILNGLPELGPVRLRRLIDAFGTAQRAVEAAPAAWSDAGAVERELAVQLGAAWSEGQERGVREMERVVAEGIRIYLAHAGPFPEPLRHIGDPPPVLYARGQDLVQDAPAVAIVGSRRSSSYGERVARRLAADLAVAGVTTVSGLARGIDTVVHTSTVEAGGRTVAVIGSGLSRLYPPENRQLASRIAASGCVISEFPMSADPFPANFPRRNRIISGLTRATVLVEGAETSGSLITARLAAEQGRDVFAVPGPVTSPLSRAPHLLIKTGAGVAESALDVLDSLGLPALPGLTEQEPESQEDRQVLEALGEESCPRELLSARVGKSVSALSMILLRLEMAGFITAGSDGRIRRR